MHFPSAAEVQFWRIRWLRKVPETIAYFLQHLLAVAAAVACGKSFGSHLSVSFGFLASLHVKACVGHKEGDEEDAKRFRVAPMGNWNLRYFFRSACFKQKYKVQQEISHVAKQVRET